MPTSITGSPTPPAVRQQGQAQPPRPLEGKRVFITGGSRGLGRSMALCFAGQGARVAFNYAESQDDAAQTLQDLADIGTPGLALQATVLDSQALQGAVGSVEKAWGGIDILVNNAGISQPLPFPLLDEADWDKVFAVNAKGAYLATRTVLRGMIRQRSGRILNIGSLAGMRLLEAPAHYAASKAAMTGFTLSLSKEVARYGVRVNCLAPGLLEDGVGASLPAHRRDDYIAHTALRRLGRFAEVARCAAFMVSDRNSYMNGGIVVMDGGI